MTTRVLRNASSLNFMASIVVGIAFVVLAVALVAGGAGLAMADRTADRVGFAGIMLGGLVQFGVLGTIGYWARTYAAAVLADDE